MAKRNKLSQRRSDKKRKDNENMKMQQDFYNRYFPSFLEQALKQMKDNLRDEYLREKEKD